MVAAGAFRVNNSSTYQQQIAWPAPVVVLLIGCFALPPETSVSLGSLRLSPYRVILIIMFVPALMRLTSSYPYRIILPDVFMGLHALWAAIALAVNMGFADGMESGGIYVFETLGAYLIGRAYISNTKDFVAVVKLFYVITSCLLFFAFLEAFSGQHLLRDLFKSILGGAGAHAIEPRLGLTRAFTSFEHPILFGVFAASCFACTFYLLVDKPGLGQKFKKLLPVLAATFFSLSGGPYTVLALQMGLIIWDRTTINIKGRWEILCGIFAGIWCLISLLSNRSPLLVFISYLTFSANSAYNRVHIWNYGSAEVARNPIFGIGLNDWIRAPWMSSSMDNFWLVTTTRYGVPALCLLLLAIIFIVRAQRAKKSNDPTQKNAIKAWTITLIGFSIAGLTVHFWNALMVQFFFFIGCGVALQNPTRNPQATHVAAPIISQLQERRQAWI